MVARSNRPDMPSMSADRPADRPAVPNSTDTAEKSADAEASERPVAAAFPLAPDHLADQDLPFIPASVVAAASQPGTQRPHWLVVDGVVYDYRHFAAAHPGGPDVLQSFRGKDCTWQFHRLHGQGVLRVYGRPLRVGRTEGVANPFRERPQFVGLRSLEADFL